MVQSNQNENVMKIETKFCEIFQNDVSMEKEPLLEITQENESLQTQMNVVPKSDQERVNKDFRFCMLIDCFGNLMVEMHYVEPFMLSMTIHK
jgi:hypothetical protein